MTSGPARVERATVGRRDDPAAAVALSPALVEAQARLEARRATLGIVPRADLDGAAVAGQGQAAASRARPSALDQGQGALEAARLQRGINYCRPTVGAANWSAWAVERAAAGDVAGAALDQGAPTVGHIETGHAAASTGRLSAFPEDDQGQGGAAASSGGRVEALAGVMATVYPTLAAGFLASKHIAPIGRLWLLLRAWDTAGRGCYSLDQVHSVFSVKGSAWRVADRRQVQRLIKAGAGTFWTLRDYHGGRYHGLQMTGPAGVAAALGLDHLAGAPVAVPVADLLGGMHRAGAALFAAVATLRRTRRGGSRPVARRTLADLTGRAASTQRTYSKTARIEARPNYVILPSGDVDAPGVFVLLDYLGQQGRAGRSHLARQMPNTYVAPLAAASRGRLRKINRRLNLVISGAQGTRGTRANCDGRGYRPEVDYRRIYHETALGAARAYGRDYHDDHFWPVGRTSAGAGLWHMVEAV